MRFFEPCSTMPAWHAWLLVMSIIFAPFCSGLLTSGVSFISVFFYHSYCVILVFLLDKCTWSKNAYCLQWFNLSKSSYSQFYEKKILVYDYQVLRLSSRAFNSIGSGEITNLLSNDAGKIEWTLCFMNYLWVC